MEFNLCPAAAISEHTIKNYAIPDGLAIFYGMKVSLASLCATERGLNYNNVRLLSKIVACAPL